MTTTENNVTICQDCNGTGADPGGLSEFYKTDCFACGGSGTVEEDDEDVIWCNWCQERAAVEDDRDSLCEACAAEREERKIEAARDRYWDARIDEAMEEVA